jgi:hypothetical protein
VRPSLAFAAASAALVLLALATTIPLLRSGSEDGRRAPVAAAAVATGTGESLRRIEWGVMPTGAPSRDGRYIGAVDWNTRSGVGLAVLVDLATGQHRPIVEPTGDEATWGAYAISTSLSPDSRLVAYSWFLPGPVERGELRVVGVDGTGTRVLLTHPAGELLPIGWSPDGSRVLTLITGREPGSTLAWVDLQPGPARTVMRFPHVPMASLSPNGRDLVFDRPERHGTRAHDLFIADTVTGLTRPLLAHQADDAMPVWLADGRHVLFASNRDGSYGAWMVDATARDAEPQQVRGSMGWWQPLGAAPGGELFYIAQTGLVDVYTVPVDLERGSIGPRSRLGYLCGTQPLLRVGTGCRTARVHVPAGTIERHRQPLARHPPPGHDGRT